MDHEEAGRYWDGNAEAWTRLARAGYDVYRDHLNTPAFFAMLPDVAGLSGLGIGCGGGANTRLLARGGGTTGGGARGAASGYPPSTLPSSSSGTPGGRRPTSRWGSTTASPAPWT